MDKANTIWILKLEPKRRCFSRFGDEFDFFIKHVKELQLALLVRIEVAVIVCTQTFDDNNNMIFTYDVYQCRNCKSSKNVKKTFENRPYWLFIQNLIKNNSEQLTIFYDLPSELLLNSKKYILLMCNFSVDAHFKSIFKLLNELFIFDDIYEDLNKNIC